MPLHFMPTTQFSLIIGKRWIIDIGLTIASHIFAQVLESSCEEQVTTQGYLRALAICIGDLLQSCMSNVWLFMSVYLG